MDDYDGDSDYEIFDDVTTKAINDEVSRCMDDAVVTLGVQSLKVDDDENGETDGKEESKKSSAGAGGGGGGGASQQRGGLGGLKSFLNGLTGRGVEGTVEVVEPKIKIHTFTETIVDMVIRGQLMVLDQSCYVWLSLVGGTAKQGAFVTAVKTKYEQIPIVSLLAAGDGEQFSPGLAQRLSKKTGMAVYASCDLPDEAIDVLPKVEGRLLALLSEL